ncbi:hypothetical protein J4573_12775 [Actinomadura barringtoniae]|uniref:Mce-associated membrane protein n=1 Tax=Actinomadura barringtoniae TaxID=1427535 RepID=A0A939T9H1_9ACTN|nr:hypothetical protein [Actinomadura barringtoniae]MBO2447970.1 hypothetical protein [Actinomadura barringtoniae]
MNRRTQLLGALAAATVALGGTAAWSAAHADTLTSSSSARNAALSDNGATSEVKGQVTSAVNTVFSYNYADTAKTEKAAADVLTGKAVQQYAQMFALVRQQAPQQKQILTTTVTDSAVKSLTSSRARLLVFADQRNTRTDKNQTSYSAAVFAVTAIHVAGKWKIEDIDTFRSE